LADTAQAKHDNTIFDFGVFRVNGHFKPPVTLRPPRRPAAGRLKCNAIPISWVAATEKG
jgi:hypothetical protein